MRAMVNGSRTCWLFLSVVLIGGVCSSAFGAEEYLMLVAEQWESSQPVNQLADFRTDQGFEVIVHIVTPDMTNEQIRAYIKSLWYFAVKPEYIVIVGDSPDVPHWIGGGTKQAVTDLPYGCMDGGDDWYPEIPVGRFAVSTLDELQAVVDKTITVESGAYPDPNYTLRAAFLATDDAAAEAEQTHDWVINNYMDPAGYESIRIYAGQGGGTADVMDAINSGCTFAVYFGHSGSTGWWAPSFDQGDIESLSNEGLYGLVFGFSCSTAHFDYPECFGETWIRETNKGAAAYISASTFIYYGGSQWESSRRLEKYFFQSFFVDDVWEIGRAWHNGLYRLLADPNYGDGEITRNMFEMFAILGDPALRLPEPGSGVAMAVLPTTGLAAEGTQGGPFTPDNKTYRLVNNAEFPISFTVSVDQPWVDIDNPSGTIPVDSEVEVIVSINSLADDFSNGYYEAIVDFVNTTDHDGDTTRTVSLTVGVPVPQILMPLDSDPGWSTEGLWAYGQPLGGGGAHGGPDPTSGYTGPNVYGYNLSGDYESSLPERHLTSGPVDCSGLFDVQLKFMRWLGVETSTYDHAYVRVSNDGQNWVTVWSNPGEVSDYAWTQQSIDISAVADDQPAVYLRWTMGETDSMWEWCGWNIDDIEIWGIEGTYGNGDFDGDGDIDLKDFAAFQPCFGLDATGPCEPGNMAGGPIIDLDDFDLLCDSMQGPQ